MPRDRETAFLESITDSDCRAMLSALEGNAKSAKELSEECDIPSSTAYRKIDQLKEAGLVVETVRLRRSGRHYKVYQQNFDEAQLTITADGVEVEIQDSTRDPRPLANSQI